MPKKPPPIITTTYGEDDATEDGDVERSSVHAEISKICKVTDCTKIGEGQFGSVFRCADEAVKCGLESPIMELTARELHISYLTLMKHMKIACLTLMKRAILPTIIKRIKIRHSPVLNGKHIYKIRMPVVDDAVTLDAALQIIRTLHSDIDAIHVMQDILEYLIQLNECNVFHNDIKMDNILAPRARPTEWKIIDWDMAKVGRRRLDMSGAHYSTYDPYTTGKFNDAVRFLMAIRTKKTPFDSLTAKFTEHINRVWSNSKWIRKMVTSCGGSVDSLFESEHELSRNMCFSDNPQLELDNSVDNSAENEIESMARDSIFKMVQRADVLVFTKSTCAVCDKAIRWLQSNQLFYHEVQLDQMQYGDSIQSALHLLTDQKTVPNIFYNGEHIGGWDELKENGLHGSTNWQQNYQFRPTDWHNNPHNKHSNNQHRLNNTFW
jgi:glutaredoxin 3